MGSAYCGGQVLTRAGRTKLIARRHGVPVALQDVWPYLTLSEGTGRTMPVSELIAIVGRFNWAEGIRATATLAAIAANSPETLRKWSADALRAEVEVLGAGSAQLVNYLHAEPRRPVAHAEGIHALQSLFVSHGSDGPGLPPSPARICHLLLAVNDHVGMWDEPVDLTPHELALSCIARAARFDRSEDFVREIARAEGLYRMPPPTGSLSEPKAWSDFIHAALGAPVEEVVDRELLPLAVISRLWGDESDPSWYFPIVTETAWSQVARTSECFADLRRRLAWTRDELRGVLGPGSTESLQQQTGHFFQKPFIAMPEGEIVAASPGAVHWMPRAGIWSRCLAHARTGLRGGADAWFSNFGYLTEAWCRHVGELGVAEGLKDRLISPDVSGDSTEITDLLFVREDRVAIIEVKSRMMRADVIRSARSPKAVVDWYEQFFFDKKQRDHRAESFWQLQKVVERIRAGEFCARGIRRDARIYPVLVSYDDIGDYPGLYPWLRERCAHHRIFQSHRVEHPVVCGVADLELLIAAGVRCHGVMPLLHRKTRRDMRDMPLRSALRRLLRGNLPRLHELESQYESMMQRAQSRLFGPRSTSEERDERAGI